MQATASESSEGKAPREPDERGETTATPDALAAELYALVVHLHKNCNSDLFEAVNALELTLSQVKLLHHLEDAGRELALKQAAELVHVSLPAASRMVDDLVRRGFVERHEDATDRRMKRVSPTEGGRAVIRRLNATRLSGLQQFVRGLAAAERDRLAAALESLLAREEIAACRPSHDGYPVPSASPSASASRFTLDRMTGPSAPGR